MPERSHQDPRRGGEHSNRYQDVIEPVSSHQGLHPAAYLQNSHNIKKNQTLAVESTSRGHELSIARRRCPRACATPYYASLPLARIGSRWLESTCRIPLLKRNQADTSMTGKIETAEDQFAAALA